MMMMMMMMMMMITMMRPLDTRLPFTAGHVTRLQPDVCSKFFTFLAPRGRFSRTSFTSTFICMNVLLSHVGLLLIYRNDLFLSFNMNFSINKSTVLSFVFCLLFFTGFEQQPLENLQIQYGVFKTNASLK